jgi:hypothetical protein
MPRETGAFFHGVAGLDADGLCLYQTARRVISSAVERFVHIEDVGSSNLSSPTIFPHLCNAANALG